MRMEDIYRYNVLNSNLRLSQSPERTRWLAQVTHDGKNQSRPEQLAAVPAFLYQVTAP